MLIDIITVPEVVSPIGNEILLQLQSNNRYSNNGSDADLTFTFTGIDETAGHTFSISWGTLELTFTLAASPDDSGNQIMVATGGQSVHDWMDVFAAYLMLNYYLRRDFLCTVDYDDDKIYLQSKEINADYTVTVDSENLTNVALAVVDGVDPVARENYELICLTELFNGSTYEQLAEDRIIPDADGLAEFDLHDLFSTELAAEHTWPEVFDSNYAARPNHIKKYKLHYAEIYEDIVRRLDPYADISEKYAILGGFDYTMLAGLNGIEYTFLDFITTYKAFLTWQPTSKIINRTQPEKLYFMIFNDISCLEVHMKVYFTDGTDNEVDVATIQPVAQYEVYELMIGYAVYDFTKVNPQDKDIERYEIWLTDNSNPGVIQSQVRTFILETKSYRYERIFLFRNSFGAFDTFRATGRKTQNNEYERMITERNDEGFSLQEQYQALERSVFTVNTGWLTFAQRNWLRELLLSKEVYEIIGDYKFPVILTDEKRDFRDDDNYLYSLEINYKYAFKDPVYSGDYVSMPLLAENLEILLNEDGEPLYG